MSIRQWLPIAGIVISVFVFNMSEFMPIGLLTSISEDFGTSEATTGMIVSMYAWAVALLSLPIMLLARRIEYRKLLLASVGTFTLFQFISGMSVSYWMLMASRIGVAIGHSVFWSIAAMLAVKVIPNGNDKLAIGLVATGTSIAMIAGLPLGRVIGLIMGWRTTFFSIAAVSFLTMVLLALVFPRVDNPGTFTLKRVPDIFRNKVLVGIYILVATLVTGVYTCYSYIEPFLEYVADMSEGMITIALIVFGMAGILGSIIFSKFYASLKYRLMTLTLVSITASLALLLPSSSSPAGVVMVIILWGTSIACFNTIFQNEVLAATPGDAPAVAMSLFSGIYNLGIALGSMVGGAVTNHDIGYIGYVGAAMALAGTLFTVFYLVRMIRRCESERNASMVPDGE